MTRFERWRRVLLAMTVLFGVQALGWAVLGAFDPFGFYERHMARALWSTERLSDDARRAFAFVLIPFGATTAAFFLLVHRIVRHAFARREQWAYRAVVAATLLWFVADSGLCMLRGAWFNIAIVNLPCLVALGVPLVMLRPYFRTPPQ